MGLVRRDRLVIFSAGQQNMSTVDIIFFSFPVLEVSIEISSVSGILTAVVHNRLNKPIKSTFQILLQYF